MEINSTKDKLSNKTYGAKTKHVKPKSFDLYERTRNQSVQKKILFQELEKIKSKKEVEGCTFQPIVNKNFHSRNSLRIYRIDDEKREIDFFDRNTVWTTKKNENIEFIKSIKMKKDNECTFRPKINKSIPNLICDFVDKNTQKYCERVKNARKIKEETMEKIHKNISYHDKKTERLFTNQNRSNENNAVFRKLELNAVKTNLRNQLHSIKFNEEF